MRLNSSDHWTVKYKQNKHPETFDLHLLTQRHILKT